MDREEHSARISIMLFLMAAAAVGLAMGMSDYILANYFKEAYGINAMQRGLIELPRELPGILSIGFLAALAFLGDIKNAIVAQLLCAVGIVALALVRPSFSVMLAFLFIYSSGIHMFIPLGDSIGMSLARKTDAGHMLGQFNSVRMAFLMISGIITFVGFRVGWFSFDVPVTVFLFSALALVVAAALFYGMHRADAPAAKEPPGSLAAVGAAARGKAGLGFVWNRKYARYYVICALFGGRKQIMYVYSPWVLIDLLDFKADTMSILAVIGSLIGIFFMPVVGRWIDRHGARKVMMAEALAFIAVYVAYGFLSRWVNTGVVALTGLGMMLVYLLNIIDKMSAQFAMVRAIYMRQIAVKPEDVTPSLTLGMGIDHVVAIVGAFACGGVWFVWGPEYVFMIAGALSLANLIAAWGIRD
ncbi:MAG: MFS transporter [Clostridiales Family XIII bacterium]|jgi:predicted MFS family arabinose efflux permease|nr:MFS transporter [Clostridiales Family XIII bacterium]